MVVSDGFRSTLIWSKFIFLGEHPPRPPYSALHYIHMQKAVPHGCTKLTLCMPPTRYSRSSYLSWMSLQTKLLAIVQYVRTLWLLFQAVFHLSKAPLELAGCQVVLQSYL